MCRPPGNVPRKRAGGPGKAHCQLDRSLDKTVVMDLNTAYQPSVNRGSSRYEDLVYELAVETNDGVCKRNDIVFGSHSSNIRDGYAVADPFLCKTGQDQSRRVSRTQSCIRRAGLTLIIAFRSAKPS